MEEIEMEVAKIGKDDIAIEIQDNIQAEAKAVIDYNILLKHVRESELPKTQVDFIEAEVYEIIGDELNHQERLKTLYSAISGIKANKN